jgi:hypothetical protein
MDISSKESLVKKQEEKKKNKFSASRLAIVLLLVIMTAGATGGVMWYFMDQVNVINKKTIDDLRNQITAISEDVKDNTDKDEDSENDELIYKNDEYNFEMEFTKNWEGYKVFKHVDSKDETVLAYYYAALPTTDADWDESPAVDKGYASLFAFSVYTKQQWEDINSEEVSMSGEFVVENDSYVIAWSHAQAAPSDFTNDKNNTLFKANADINQIINSIKFTN